MRGKNKNRGEMPGIRVTLAAVAEIIFIMCMCAAPVFSEEARPCAEEIAKFCNDARPGGGRIISCLKNHEGELSPVCRDKLQEVQRKIDEAKLACKTDIEKFCKGVEPGEGRIARCLDMRGSELSPVCAEKLDLLKARLKRNEPAAPEPVKGGDREK